MAIDLQNERPTEAAEMSSAAWHCPDELCSREVWYVRADERTRGLWHIGEQPDAGGWQVAAETPICPCCAAALVIPGAQAEPEIGPFAALLAGMRG